MVKRKGKMNMSTSFNDDHLQMKEEEASEA